MEDIKKDIYNKKETILAHIDFLRDCFTDEDYISAQQHAISIKNLLDDLISIEHTMVNKFIKAKTNEANN